MKLSLTALWVAAFAVILPAAALLEDNGKLALRSTDHKSGGNDNRDVDDDKALLPKLWCSTAKTTVMCMKQPYSYGCSPTNRSIVHNGPKVSSDCEHCVCRPTIVPIPHPHPTREVGPLSRPARRSANLNDGVNLITKDVGIIDESLNENMLVRDNTERDAPPSPAWAVICSKNSQDACTGQHGGVCDPSGALKQVTGVGASKDFDAGHACTTACKCIDLESA